MTQRQGRDPCAMLVSRTSRMRGALALAAAFAAAAAAAIPVPFGPKIKNKIKKERRRRVKILKRRGPCPVYAFVSD